MSLFNRSDVRPVTLGAEARAQQFIATEKMLDVGLATTASDQVEGGRPSYLVRLELTSFGPSREYSARGNLPGTNLVIPVEEKDLTSILRLQGRRLLLTQPAPKSSVVIEELEAEVHRLRVAHAEIEERFEALRTNYLTLVEESRRLY